MRHVSFLGSAVIFAAALASAQSSTPANQSSPATYSSSNDSDPIQLAEFAAPDGMAALPSAPKPSSSAGGQEGGGHGGWRQSVASNFALELGGGFNAPPATGEAACQAEQRAKALGTLLSVANLHPETT